MVPVLIICLIILYWAPSIFGFTRRHHQRWPIFLVNLFLGFTFIGWVVALVWSFSYSPSLPSPKIDA